MSSEWAIRLRGVAKCYPAFRRPTEPLWRQLRRRRRSDPGSPDGDPSQGVWAVRGVDLEVDRGETVGLIGRNGCGKSSLLQMVCGTLEPTRGRVEVRGRVAALLELGAGFNPDFTGRENVRLNASILGLGTDEIEARMDEVVDFADIGDALDRPVRFYSSGMFARLAFAVAINVDPDILVVDEILSVGDEAFQRKCYARIEEIRSAGTTVLFVSHSTSTVAELCDRVWLMEGGEILFDGTPKDAVTHYHRLLYAPPDRVEAFRDSLRSGGAEIAEGDSPSGPEADAPAADPAPDRAAGPDAAEGYFEPDLIPESTVVYDAFGARIRDARVCTRDGRTVNGLLSGRTYVFEYVVDFEKDCFDVRYHMMLKRVSGLELGGGFAPPVAEPGHEVPAGEARRVRFEFDCHLNSGVYFLNCGVTGNGGDQLHRIVDAVVFRVLPIADSTVFGAVHFGCRPAIDAVECSSAPDGPGRAPRA